MAKRAPSRFRGSIDPEHAGFEVEVWPFYQVTRLVGVYYLRLDATLKPLGIDAARWRVLMTLSSGKADSVSRIAEEAAIRISTMAKIIQRMALEGLVETRPSREDARRTEVVPTEAGLDLLRQVRSKIGKLSREAFDGLTDDELTSFNAVARKLQGNLRP